MGVTAGRDVTDPHALLWSSGVHQNVVFLLLLLQRLPEVELAALVSCPDGAAGHPVADLFGLPHLPQSEAVERLDVLIELGQRADGESMRRFRARGGKLVSYMAGNAMAMNFEAVANRSGHGEVMSEAGFDAVWITPQHWRMNRSYAALTRCPAVELAPHIWSPVILEQSAARLGARPWWRPPEPGRGWRLGVFEPNVNVLKTFHLPLLVCEEAYRRSPELIDRVLLCGSARLMSNLHFQEVCAATDLDRDGRLFAEGRHPLAGVMGAHVDAVVTHQWENALNYLYWDTLHLGWPLVHNSEAIREIGYYFPPFEPRAGGEAVCEGLREHAHNRGTRRPAELEALWSFHIDNPIVQRRHAELLEAAAG